MPFRMLGIVPDLASLEEIGSRAFPGYTARGVEVTVASASGADPAGVVSRARLLGIESLVLLDYRPAELDSPDFAGVLTDVILAIRPHVVVIGSDPAIAEAGRRAFAAARSAALGRSRLPAKLYLAAEPQSTQVSTVVRAGTHSAGRVTYRRLFPNPWVTGVVETDLFAGLSPGSGDQVELSHLRLAG